MKQKFGFISACLLLAVGAVWALGRWWAADATVEVAVAQVGPIDAFVDVQAKTRLPQTWLVTMPYPAHLEPITLAEGDPVKKGQLVAQVTPRDLELLLEEAQAAVDRIEAAITENAYTEVEKTILQQAQQYVQAMDTTVSMARERVRAGQTRFDYAEKTLNRLRQLAKSQAVSEDQLDRANLEYVEASVGLAQDRLVLSAVESLAAATNLLPTMVRRYIEGKTYRDAVLQKERAQALAHLRKVQQDVERGRMQSPFDGVVLRRFVSDRRFLQAGEPLLELGQLEQMEVEAEVLTLEAAQIRPGAEVEIYGASIGPKPVRGYVHRIYPAGFTKLSSLGIEQQMVLVIVRFAEGQLPRLLQRGLGVAYRVRVKIFTERKSSALQIPRSALVRAADGAWQVFRVEQGRLRRQPVELGLSNDQSVEVLQGLSDGDTVVLSPEPGLEEGLRVRPALP